MRCTFCPSLFTISGASLDTFVKPDVMMAPSKYLPGKAILHGRKGASKQPYSCSPSLSVAAKSMIDGQTDQQSSGQLQ